MKKLFLTVALAAAVAGANAQDMMSKKGTPILPEAGDWSIGFDAAPWMNYFGNLMSNAGNNSVNAAFQESNTIVGKYMKDANTAYRAKVRIGFGSTTLNNILDQDGSTSNPPATVTDELKESGMNITLGGGIQKYRGKGRLRGYYGAELGISLGSAKETYSYGNAFSSTNQAPTSTIDWSTGQTSAVGSRPTEVKAGSTFGFNLRGFIGAEYFFAPKMSIGAEYGWGLGLSSTGEGEATVESWDLVANGVRSTTSKTGKASSFGLDVDNASGQIVLSLYF
jgi:hypothetical protein